MTEPTATEPTAPEPASTEPASTGAGTNEPTAAEPASAESTPRSARSATLDAVQTTSPATAPPARARASYRDLWRQVPRDLGFLLLTLPVVIAAITTLSTVFFTGVGLVGIFVGLFIVVAALYIARGFGAFELLRLRWAAQPAITPPLWAPPGEAATPLRMILGPLVNGHYWLYLLHGMVVNFILGVVSWVVTVVWLSVGLGGVTYWIWGRFVPAGEGRIRLYDVVLDWLLPANTLSVDPFVAESVFQLIVGTIFLVDPAVRDPDVRARAPRDGPRHARRLALGGAAA